jgi:hypothetical protein
VTQQIFVPQQPGGPPRAPVQPVSPAPPHASEATRLREVEIAECVFLPVDGLPSRPHAPYSTEPSSTTVPAPSRRAARRGGTSCGSASAAGARRSSRPLATRSQGPWGTRLRSGGTSPWDLPLRRSGRTLRP